MMKFNQYINENIELSKEMIISIMAGDLDKVKELVSQGADIHYKDGFPLWRAVASSRNILHEIKPEEWDKKYLKIIEFLLEKGASLKELSEGDFDRACYFSKGFQLLVFKYDPLLARSIKNPDKEILSKISHFTLADKFGVFDND